MKILITGGTGFIGQQLVPLLSTQHKITVLSRDTKKAIDVLGEIPRIINTLDEFNHLDHFDVIINLAGEPIVGKRWTEQQKQQLCQSRWEITSKLSQLISKSEKPPACFISASAIGYYGTQSSSPVDESARPNNEFIHQLCQEWERLALLSQSESTRVCIIRIGIVLDANGGALSKMLPPFKLGLGGPIASGKQGMSWIHLRDLIRVIQYLISESTCKGCFNATAPNPVSNLVFSKALAKHLKRPAILPMPSLVLNLAMGEMSKLLTEGQFVIPQRLIDTGFEFNYPTIDRAFKQITGSR
ncbi:TIGR01777 family protein [Shewanella sp. OPT22]|nr:TIGR01777 family protein [Shewanella sp. OPT22]